jgi:hypothetical protein
VKGFSVWASKLTAWFGDLGIKIITIVSWFWHQNQEGYNLSVAPQNQRKDKEDARHASRFSGLLLVETSRVTVSQSGLTTGGGAAWMVYVTSS